ncbi:conserved hypothetical protein [uncultured delta proteobacterium]|uniref:LarA-like N-terminal domain-containing protein n=1 Tax=uncultured delta proteobacterium TaxID=34034 RepID=A0A212KBJ8_9DELT|nr:conserved hypothetical protein [uncultured delta proteobacterium]
MCAMQAVRKLLETIPVPPLHWVRRPLDHDGIRDVAAAVTQSLDDSGLRSRLPKGGEIAIGVGSRGLSHLPELVRATVGWFKKEGTRPFVIPCMGSHGGATAEGQAALLEHLGITGESVGCLVRSSMDVVQLGTLPRGLPVYMDALAAAADGVFIINRVKLHTSFSGRHESGIVKMITIGLGKQKGADSAHRLGFGAFAAIMPEMAGLVLGAKKNVLGALATVENAAEEVCLVETVLSERILERDAALLQYAAGRMPAFPAGAFDVLVLSRMGKEISGAGMDYNVIGRYSTPYKTGGPKIKVVGVLDLTDASEGNASGVGVSDLITRRLAEKIDRNATYANQITSTSIRSAAIPMTLDTDQDLFRCAIKSCLAEDPARVRLIWARDTLTLDRLLVSPELARELKNVPGCAVDDAPRPIVFERTGNLAAPDPWARG